MEEDTYIPTPEELALDTINIWCVDKAKSNFTDKRAEEFMKKVSSLDDEWINTWYIEETKYQTTPKQELNRIIRGYNHRERVKIGAQRIAEKLFSNCSNYGFDGMSMLAASQAPADPFVEKVALGMKPSNQLFLQTYESVYHFQEQHKRTHLLNAILLSAFEFVEPEEINTHDKPLHLQTHQTSAVIGFRAGIENLIIPYILADLIE